jgi:hypothetical protein
MSPKQLTQNQTVPYAHLVGRKISDERAPCQWHRFAKAEYLYSAEAALNILRDHQCSRCATIQSAELRFLFNARWISSLIGWLGFGTCAAFCRSEPVEETELDEH